MNGTLASSPTLTVEPDMVNFDNAVVGNPSSVTLIMQNEGVDNIVIGTITISGKDTIEFTLQNDNCSNRILSPFIACTVQVVLVPKSNGAKGAVMNIPYNDSEVKYRTVSMAGVVIPDTVPPDTVITMKPLNPSNESWATFNFTSTEVNSTFECRKDSDDFTVCTNPVGYVYLADGEHTFSVRATDLAGNTDLSPAVYTWTVDTIKPASAITSPQDNSVVIGTIFTIKGTASDTETGVQKVEVSTDGGTTWNLATDTTSWSYDWTIPSFGTFTIISRATDNAGNVEVSESGVTVTTYTGYAIAVSGSGYNYPLPGFRASLSLNVNGLSLGTSWLKYYYSKMRLNFVSTSITGISVSGNKVTITGTGTVNAIPGYTFTVTITDGDPDEFSIEIRNPDGTPYFSDGPRPLSGGDFRIGTVQYQLNTSVSPSNAGNVNPDCAGGCWYESDTLVTLTASGNSGYEFSNWAGCASAFYNVCTVTMNTDKNITAAFSLCPATVMIMRTAPVYYSTLQDAYDDADDGDIILSQTGIYSGDLNINRNISVTLEGGYNCDYSAQTGKTILNGMITISDGVITIEDFELQ